MSFLVMTVILLFPLDVDLFKSAMILSGVLL